MFRVLMRVFTSAPCFGLIGLLIMVPLSLGIFAACRHLLAGRKAALHRRGLCAGSQGWQQKDGDYKRPTA